MIPCRSDQPSDISFASCASWCQAAQLKAHCGWCKCRSCEFCPGATELAAAAKALLPPRYDCHPTTPPPRTAGPLRLTACGPDLFSSDGHPVPVILTGVGMYLEWRMPPLYQAKAMADVPTLRERIPSANLIRFVGVLWKDSIKESDGLECSDSDAASGYLKPSCLERMDEFMQSATQAGLWVILAARAKYAAGYTWPDQPDVWHDQKLRVTMLEMWRFVAARYRHLDRVAGYEIMSEPRTKTVSQREVMAFMGEGCEAIAQSDPRALCIVGPAPYYKVWNLREDILLHRRNVVYTFDFFTPWPMVTADSSKSDITFPSRIRCAGVYDTWWGDFCESTEELVMIDEAWLRATIDALPGRLRTEYGVPVFCNQWGVKGEWLASRGRLQYAEALLSAFTSRNISSSYWIWRSMQKGGRPLGEPVWGFEIVHNNGEEQALDTDILRLLSAGRVVKSAAPPMLGRNPYPPLHQLPPPPSAPLLPPPLPLPLWFAPSPSTLALPTKLKLPSISYAGGSDRADTPLLLHTGTVTTATAEPTPSLVLLFVGLLGSGALLALACACLTAVAYHRTAGPVSRPRRTRPATRLTGTRRPRIAPKYTQLDGGRGGDEPAPHMVPRARNHRASACCTGSKPTPPIGEEQADVEVMAGAEVTTDSSRFIWSYHADPRKWWT